MPHVTHTTKTQAHAQNTHLQAHLSISRTETQTKPCKHRYVPGKISEALPQNAPPPDPSGGIFIFARRNERGRGNRWPMRARNLTGVCLRLEKERWPNCRRTPSKPSMTSWRRRLSERRRAGRSFMYSLVVYTVRLQTKAEKHNYVLRHRRLPPKQDGRSVHRRRLAYPYPEVLCALYTDGEIPGVRVYSCKIPGVRVYLVPLYNTRGTGISSTLVKYPGTGTGTTSHTVPDTFVSYVQHPYSSTRYFCGFGKKFRCVPETCVSSVPSHTNARTVCEFCEKITGNRGTGITFCTVPDTFVRSVQYHCCCCSHIDSSLQCSPWSQDRLQ